MRGTTILILVKNAFNCFGTRQGNQKHTWEERATACQLHTVTVRHTPPLQVVQLLHADAGRGRMGLVPNSRSIAFATISIKFTRDHPARHRYSSSSLPVELPTCQPNQPTRSLIRWTRAHRRPHPHGPLFAMPGAVRARRRRRTRNRPRLPSAHQCRRRCAQAGNARTGSRGQGGRSGQDPASSRALGPGRLVACGLGTMPDGRRRGVLLLVPRAIPAALRPPIYQAACGGCGLQVRHQGSSAPCLIAPGNPRSFATAAKA